MQDLIRIVLVDPNKDSQNTLRGLLSGIATIWVAEVFETYRGLAARMAEIAPDMIIVSLDHDPIQAVELIHELTLADPNTVILPASRTSDSVLILRAIRAGAREFLTIPCEEAELLEIITRLLRGRRETQSSTPRGPLVISVTGAGGGVGSTSIAVNLGASLAASKEQETILVDFDMIFGSVDSALDILSDNTIYTVLQNFERLDKTLLKRSMTRHSSGLYVLPHPLAIEEAAKIDPNTLHRLLGLLKAAFSTVVIDTSKGLQSPDFTAFEMSDVILVVVQLELVCVRNTARLISMFQQFEGLAERVKLVINRAGSIEMEISLKKAEEILKMPISWQIPNATKIFQAARIRGVPIGDIAKGSRPHQVYLEMARALRPVPEGQATKERKGLFAALF
jgi:pilus assembly protein CpaE